ncbi:nitrilase-related carbon-nitrogen hydrolase [Celerinatantimonas sp. MCCC 1A17872]|uniref:nitrilase-related carbon-nitrogen hydrolase n=1 Tax=Celerinatantimonas sp. MCCC 1A17872 TaxID=3177514 RepID=UPI0038C2E366
MADYLTITTASLRQLPFDFSGNVKRVTQAIEQAFKNGANILLMPELALTGYGCEDNFTFQEFHEATSDALDKVIQATKELGKDYPAMLVSVGLPLLYPGGQVYNASAIISAKGLHGFVCKQFLARNGLHYEPRWFEAWPRSRVIEHPHYRVPMGDLVVDCKGVRIGFETCEDSWISNRPGRDLYQRNVDIILNPSASHFASGKFDIREQFILEGSRAFGVAYAYANLNGTENGTSIFDAGCMIASEGRMVSYGDRFNCRDVLLNHAIVNISANRVTRITSSEAIGAFKEELEINLPYTLTTQTPPWKQALQPAIANDLLNEFWEELSDDDRIHAEICYAIANGLWDWMQRTHTHGYIVSMSGGADSGLAATLVYLSHYLALHQLGAQEYRKKLPKPWLESIPEYSEESGDYGYWLKQYVMPKVLMCLYQGTDNSSEITFNAAKGVSENIGATFEHWNVQKIVDDYIGLVNQIYPKQPLNWNDDDIALQNIQARSRSPGVWMLANRENKLLIATSNLSESALGYATMDGDTSGVLSVVSGLSKTRIRKINNWLEKQGLPVEGHHGFHRLTIPAMGLINAQQPTAELRPVEQTDEEDLMPYIICDSIMQSYLVRQMWPKSILIDLLMQGHGEIYSLEQLGHFIERWFRLFCRNPWKRYGTRAGFHVEQISLDPKTFHRFPLLNASFAEPLAQMWDYIKEQQTQTEHDSCQKQTTSAIKSASKS